MRARPGLVLTCFAVFILAALCGCALNRLAGPPEKWVTGELIAVQRAPQYEAICGLHARIAKACDEPPVCCAYEAVIVDTAGRHQYVYFFAPRGNRIPHVGQRAHWHLRLTEVYQLPCTYVCAYDIVYALHGDEDVRTF